MCLKFLNTIGRFPFTVGVICKRLNLKDRIFFSKSRWLEWQVVQLLAGKKRTQRTINAFCWMITIARVWRWLLLLCARSVLHRFHFATCMRFNFFTFWTGRWKFDCFYNKRDQRNEQYASWGLHQNKLKILNIIRAKITQVVVMGPGRNKTSVSPNHQSRRARF